MPDSGGSEAGAAVLNKSQTYLLIEDMMSKDIAVKPDRLETFVELLNRDLLRLDNAVRILNIFGIVFERIKAGTLPDVPLLSNTIVSIIRNLEILEKNSTPIADQDKIIILSLEILSNLPMIVLQTFAVDSDKWIYRMLDLYVCETYEIASRQLLALTFVKCYVNQLSKFGLLKFVERGTEQWLNGLVPLVFGAKKNKCRAQALQLFEVILPDVAGMKIANHSSWPTIMANVKDKSRYPKVILDAQLQSDPLWCDLWILLIKLLGVELHKIGASINPLLFVLQEGFKMEQEHKAKAFRCLMALTDNFALDPALLTHTNRLRVLSTALESNNAKNERIGLIKFDAWWHLIVTLESYARMSLSTVLLGYLKFCFGDVAKPPSTPNQSNPKTQRTNPGEVFPSVQELALAAFAEICGHAANCSCSSLNSLAKVKKPILDVDMVERFHSNFLHSLKMATLYVNSHRVDELPKAQEMAGYLKCIWSSYVKTAAGVKNPQLFAAVMRSLLGVLAYFAGPSINKGFIGEIVISTAMPAILDKTSGYSPTNLNDPNIKFTNRHTPIQTLINLVQMLFKEDSNIPSRMFESVFDRLIEVGLLGGLKPFCTWLLSSANLKPAKRQGVQFWCRLAAALSTCKNSIPANVMSLLLQWPFGGDDNISDTDMLEMAKSWTALMKIPKLKLVGDRRESNCESDSIWDFLLENVDKSNGTMVFLLPGYVKKMTVEQPGSNNISDYLSVCKNLMSKIDASKMSDAQKLLMCTSLNEFLCILELVHTYSMSDSLQNLISCTVIDTISMLVPHLTSANEALFETDNFILQLLETLNSMNISFLKEDLVKSIIELVCVVVKRSKSSFLENLCIQILEKLKSNDCRTPKTPNSELIKIKQTLDAKSNTKQSPSNKKPSDELVIIKPAWKFDPKNLTEHQKEMLKRRRDDIPALYEDLSQSQDECSMKAWKPPGYNSDSQSNSSKGDTAAKFPINLKSIDLNSVEIVPAKCTKIEEVDGKSGGKVVIRLSKLSSKELLDKMNSTKGFSTAMKESNVISSSEKSANLNKNKSDIENIEFKNPDAVSTTTTPPGRKRKSILSRVNDNLKSLKDVSGKETTVADESDLMKIANELSSDSIKIKPIDKTETSDDPKKTNEEDPKEIVQNGTTKKRPARVRRKPNKLLEVETEEPTKKLRRKTSTDSDSQNTAQSASSEEIVKDKEENPASVLKGKRKSRLFSQLAIDTREGHPLIGHKDADKSTRSSRRSRADSQTISENFSQSQKDANLVNKNVKTPKANVSIHSQETDPTFKTDDSPLVEALEKEPIVEPLSSHSSSESLHCSPDFIESSQEDTLSVKLAKSRESSMVEENATNSIKSYAKTTQEIAEADTEPLLFVSMQDCHLTEDVPIGDEDQKHGPVANDIADAETETFMETDCGESQIDTQGLAETQNETNFETIVESEKPKENYELLNTSMASSPCNDDLKERTLEFLNNTMDISPIKGDLSPKRSPQMPSPSKTEDAKIVSNIASPPSEKQNPITVTSPDLFTNDKISPSKDTNPEKVSKPDQSAIVSATIPSNANFSSLRNMGNFGSRTAHMLSLCMLNEKVDQEADENGKNEEKCASDVTSKDEQPLLEFNKTVPSSTASPIGPILKRKIEEDALTTSPSSKRKRVSFHDPPVSTTVSVEKYIAPRGVKSPQIRVCYSDKSEDRISKPLRPLVAKCLLKNMEMHAKLNEQNDEQPNGEDLKTQDSQFSDICSLNIDSPKPMNIITNYLLNDVDPIYPALVDCADPLSEIASQLSSALWKDEFLDAVKEKVSTIGHLAKLTELEVNRLPVKSPKLETVRRALSEYEAKKAKEAESHLDSMLAEDDAKLESKGDSLLGDMKLTCIVESETMETEVPDKRTENPSEAALDSSSPPSCDNAISEVEKKNAETQIDEQVPSLEDKLQNFKEFLESDSERALDIIAERIPHKTILDKLPIEALITYISDRIKSDNQFRDGIAPVVEVLPEAKALFSQLSTANEAVKRALLSARQLFNK